MGFNNTSVSMWVDGKNVFVTVEDLVRENARLKHKIEFMETMPDIEVLRPYLVAQAIACAISWIIYIKWWLSAE